MTLCCAVCTDVCLCCRTVSAQLAAARAGVQQRRAGNLSATLSDAVPTPLRSCSLPSSRSWQLHVQQAHGWLSTHSGACCGLACRLTVLLLQQKACVQLL